MTLDSDAKHHERSRHTWTAMLFAALALAAQLPATVAASPSSHAEIRRRVDRVVFSGRGYHLVHRQEVVATGSRRAESTPEPRDRDDARAARERETSDRVAVEQAAKSPKDLQRLPDSSIIIVKPAARQPLRPAAPLASVSDRRRAARETVFHDAHAPPRHA
jgi:hypothetical protein